MNKLFTVAVTAFLAVSIASAQSTSGWTCTASTASPLTIRAQGDAEPTADVLVTCGPGASFSQTSPTLTDIQLTFNAPVASKIIEGNETEAVALVNASTADLTNVPVVPGLLTAPNQLTFQAIPIRRFTSLTIRFTNLRVRASALAAQQSVTVNLRETTGDSAYVFTQQTVATTRAGLTFDTRTCDDSAPANNPTFPPIPPQNTGVLSGGNGTINFNVRFTEPFAFNFRKRIDATQDPSVPGVVYNSESIFVNSSFLPPGAGQATQGTRLLAAFRNVPANVRLFVTTRPLTPPVGAAFTNISTSTSLQATLISTDSSGVSTSFTPIPPTATASCPANGLNGSVAEIPVVNGTATAVWEVTASNAAAIEQASFGVVVVFDTPTPAAGTSIVNGVLAPLATPGQRLSTPEFEVVDQSTNAFTIGSLPPPPPPVITTPPDAMPPGTVNVSYTFPFSGTTVSPPLVWAIGPNNLPFAAAIDPATGVFATTPSAAGTYSITINLFDNFYKSTPTQKTFTWTVNPAPKPVIVTASMPAGTVGVMSSIPFQAAQGTPPYIWSLGPNDLTFPASIDPNTGVFTATPTAAKNTFTVTINVTDVNNRSNPTSKTFQWLVNPAPLRIVTTSLPDAFLRTPYNQQIQTTGGSGGNSFTYTGSLPPGLQLSLAGAITGTPTAEGTQNFIVTVTDKAGASDMKPFSIKASKPDATVFISTRSLPNGTVGQQYSQPITANGGFQPYTWSLLGQPRGLNIDANGVINGVPQQAGNFQVTVVVRDAFGNGDNALLPLTITGGPLMIGNDSLPPGIVGTAYNAPLNAIGGTAPYTFMVTGLPSGLSFTNGAITGTPSAAGTSNVTIVLTDAGKGSVTKTLSLLVNPGPPQITTTSLPAGTLGTAYVTTVAATGGTAPLTWSLPGAPAGFSIDPNTGQITGSFSNTNPVSLTVKVTDKNGLSATQQFTITVNPAAAPQITTSATLPALFVGDTFNFTPAVTGGAQPLKFQLTGGAVPSGTTFNAANGSITGPITSSALGPVSFTITVTDAANQTASRTFTGQVLNPVSIPAQTLSATVGTAFNGKINVTGGVAPYNIVIAGGAPAGLTFDAATGQFSGSPNAAGNFNLNVTVTDTANRTAQATIPLAIAFPPVQGVNVGGLPAAPAAGGQAQNLTVGLANSFPVPVTGTMTLTFTPDAAVPADDPRILFSNGKRTATFNVAQNQTGGTFTDPNLGIQLGTVAGTITLTTTLQANGVNVPCNCPPQTIVIPRSAPTIRTVTARRTSGGFTVDVTGFSPTRDLSTATFRFTQGSSGSLQTTEVTLQVGPAFTTYFQGTEGQQNGSQFTLSVPFTISGDQNAVSSVTVVLTNSVGSTTSPATAIQ